MKNIAFAIALLLSLPVFAADSAPKGQHGDHKGPGPCAEDRKKFCPEAKPGDGAIKACMEKHSSELSEGCSNFIKHMKEHKGDHKGGGAGQMPGGGE